LRSAQPELFRHGSYTPLEVLGQHADRVVAFSREQQGKQLVVVVPRWSHALLENGVQPLIPAQVWGDTRVKLPFAASTQNWKGLFQTGAVTPNKELLISTALGEFPVNVFINSDDQES
jgi:(1->4)-alpha-D-glucan 1-alpha-D-glucosylmutase